MLRSIASVIQARRDALEAILADAVAEQADEAREQAKSNAEREAASLSYHEWGQLHPDPPRGDGWHREYHAKRELAHLEEFGVPYSLAQFTGRSDLTPSARIAAQTTIRKLESSGLVDLFGAKAQSVRLTPTGWAAVGEPAHAP